MQSYSKKVSMTVVKRLPKYYQYLSDLSDRDVEKISSKELANMMGLTASQIRQDLNSFGAYGQQGYGYKVEELKDAIRDILGLNQPYNCVIIGSGNLGRAISHYERFKNEGIHIKAMFDVDHGRVGKTVGKIPVYHMDDLEQFVKENEINICILCVPREVGQEIANRICKIGIKAILNFVPLDLTVPEDVVVENVNITDSLFTLTFLLSEK
ncbi:MAG: redox-sensing transcriptional repressor Rex [Eubacteriaceae bacterium]|nr:redox-sensing transcriptional repressor Rex [Eubacteriaceae bacterium]MDD4509285.1 redox-sensing transcriptional repressor Rex [Eubacteriaceae bacterium]